MHEKRGRKSLSGSGDSPQLRVRVSARVHDDLARVAVSRGLTVSQIVRPALEQLARPTRPEELVQVELHRRVLGKLLQDPERIKSVARQNIERARARARSTTAQRWQDQWQSLIEGPIEDLVPVLVGLDEHSIDLRQVSPFAGSLDDDERREATAVGRALASA